MTTLFYTYYRIIFERPAREIKLNSNHKTFSRYKTLSRHKMFSSHSKANHNKEIIKRVITEQKNIIEIINLSFLILNIILPLFNINLLQILTLINTFLLIYTSFLNHISITFFTCLYKCVNKYFTAFIISILILLVSSLITYKTNILSPSLQKFFTTLSVNNKIYSVIMFIYKNSFCFNKNKNLR